MVWMALKRPSVPPWGLPKKSFQVSSTLGAVSCPHRDATQDNSLKTVHHGTIETVTGRGEGEEGEDEVELGQVTSVPPGVSALDQCLQVVILESSAGCT